jgi:hypothetical protein
MLCHEAIQQAAGLSITIEQLPRCTNSNGPWCVEGSSASQLPILDPLEHQHHLQRDRDLRRVGAGGSLL